ncbi:LysR family transcriptional regulator [Acuticoccus sp.]|uniref:LysR family transcriptional regulator n=1 Tax=Acuticoccus sp. TaxID=1904378 RepID=UPI003B52B264
MDRLGAMQTFVRVAEAGSFSAAARLLEVGQPAVSKTVAQLEAALGARLVVRSTRQIALTEDGRRYLELARAALEAADAADASVGGRSADPRGLVRLATSVAFARLHIVPRLGRLFERHPGITMELVLSDGFVDLVEAGVDVALRIGVLKEAGLVARRVGLAHRIVVAHPGYFARRGRPQRPQDLAAHDCVVYTQLATGNLWEFEGPEGAVSVPVSGRLRVSTADAMREAVLEGLGVGVTPTWMWRDEVAEGRLERVLAAYEPTARPVMAVFPERRLVSPKVRAVVDFVAEEFRRDAALSPSS